MNIVDLIDSQNFDLAVEEIKSTDSREVQGFIDYYNGKHPILTDPDRADYTVDTKDEDGNVTGTKTITRTKLILQYPKQIIATYISMFFGKKMTLTNSNADVADEFVVFKNQYENSLRYPSFDQKLSRQLGIESKVAEYIYIDPETKELKVTLFSKENGDDIYAHFDDFNSLDSVLRIYTSRILKGGKIEDVEVIEIYTKNAWYKSIDGATFEKLAYTFKGEKLPIIFWDQENPEWSDVKDIITKQELVHSQHSDVNKRVGNPNIVIDGDLLKMPDQTDDVKVFRTQPIISGDKTINSKVSYLQSESAPESVKMEIERLDKYIALGSWPDLSFFLNENLGSDPSGTAIKLRMTSLYVMMTLRYPMFSEMISRRLSIIKYIMAWSESNKMLELDLDFEFNSMLPTNIKEIVDTWAVAKTADITSQQQAVNNLPLNSNNPDVYTELIEEETRGGIAQ